jgi:hypothetical protein
VSVEKDPKFSNFKPNRRKRAKNVTVQHLLQKCFGILQHFRCSFRNTNQQPADWSFYDVEINPDRILAISRFKSRETARDDKVSSIAQILLSPVLSLKPRHRLVIVDCSFFSNDRVVQFVLEQKRCCF